MIYEIELPTKRVIVEILSNKQYKPAITNTSPDFSYEEEGGIEYLVYDAITREELTLTKYEHSLTEKELK